MPSATGTWRVHAEVVVLADGSGKVNEGGREVRVTIPSPLGPTRAGIGLTPPARCAGRCVCGLRIGRAALRWQIAARDILNRTCIIINPEARGARARLARLHKIARGAVIKATIGPGDAEAQAERAVEQGYETIVAAGGDGTVNEVVNGIGTAPVALGILPMGTVNVFAMELGIPFGVEEAWKVVRAQHVRRIDLASANGHFFVQMAGIGFDAQVVKENSNSIKRMIGPLSYVLTTAKLSVTRPPRLRAITHGREVAEGSFVLVGNGRFYGGPFSVFQGADSQDGLLHVLVFRGSDPVSILRYWRGALFGSVSSFSDVHYFKAKNVLIEADREVPLEVDGEVVGHSPVKFTIKQKKLHVLAPARK